MLLGQAYERKQFVVILEKWVNPDGCSAGEEL